MSAGELAPCVGITTHTWTPEPVQTSTESHSGDTSVIELGPPRWRVDVEVSLYSRAVYDIWSAFIARRRRDAVTFVMPRFFRPRPIEATGVADSSLTISGVDAANQQFTIGGGITGAPKEGDMISYRTVGGGYWIGQVVADATPSGGSVQVTVEPAPVAPRSPPDVLRTDALGEFRLDGEPRFREQSRRRTLRFAAMQVIR